MADNRKLAAGLRNLPASAREDLAGREQDIQRGKTVELLRRAGKEMYDNPIVNTAIGFTPVLGDIQAAGETMAALNRGAPWQETAGYAAGMLPFMPMIGKTVWHGSPHTFEKFDLSKIGTGEGAQAYGHGLYLAESPDVAGSYRNAGDMGWFEREADKALYSQDIDNAIASTKKELERVSKEPRYVDAKNNLTGVLNVLEARKAGANEYGQLYKVDLPDEQIAKMLDWDKPLSEQPEILGKLRSYSEQNPNINPMFRESLSPMEAGSTTGDAIYRTLNRSLDESKALMQQRDALYAKYQTGNMSMSDAVRAMSSEDRAAFSDVAQRIDDQKNVAAKTSGLLNEMGIPGIQYLDQASRGAGEGTRNYVVFSDEIPQILERNNQPVGMFK